MNRPHIPSRVVVTGMGILAPATHGLVEFEALLRGQRSAVTRIPSLGKLGFSCELGAFPFTNEEELITMAKTYLNEEELFGLDTHTLYAAISAIDCWRDAGLKRSDELDGVDWDTGVFTATRLPVEYPAKKQIVKKIRAGEVRRLGSSVVEQTMLSAVTAKICGLLSLGGEAHSGSNACASGLEAMVLGWQAVSEGRLKRALVGGCEGADIASCHYFWAPFDQRKHLAQGFNDRPEAASRPMSESATGYVPASGSAFLCLEREESARERGARIYAEVAGGAINRGMSVSEISDCVQGAILASGIRIHEIDLVNGYFPGNLQVDAKELAVLESVFGTSGAGPNLPLLNATKSLVGHTISASGAIESVGTALQISKSFVHGSLNTEDLSPPFKKYRTQIPAKTLQRELNTVLKLVFAYGGANAAVIFKKYKP